MIRTFKIIMLSIICISVLNSCDMDKCLKSQGALSSSFYEYDSFKVVDVMGVFEIELVQDTNYYIEAIAGENTLKFIEPINQNDTLKLYNYNSCAWISGYELPLLKIHFRDINTFEITESCKLYSTDSISDSFILISKTKLAEVDLILNNDKFFFYNYESTAGTYFFSGITEQFDLLGYYSALVDASALRSTKARIINHSIIDYKIYVESELYVEIHNEGSVYYAGNPVVTDSIAESASGGAYPLE